MFSVVRTNSFESVPTYQEGFHNEEARKMIYRQFGNTELCTSVLGFGGSQLALCYNTDNEQEGIETVITAIKSGINYIDTAPYYGQGKAEIVLGKALKHIPRNTYYLATKVGRYGSWADVSTMFDFTADRTIESVTESLSRLGVEYFDVLQVHDLEYAPNIDIVLNETLPALQKLKEMGKTKFIGITGYPLNKLKEVLEKSTVQIDVVLSYCRCTLFDDTLNSYISYFKEKKLAIVNAASLGMGLLSFKGPPHWHPASQEIKDACQKVVTICKDRNVDISKLAFCHSFYQSKDIHVHLTGMENKAVLKANLESVWNGLSNHEMVVREEIINYFKALKETHWENKEVNMYWEAMKSYV